MYDENDDEELKWPWRFLTFNLDNEKAVENGYDNKDWDDGNVWSSKYDAYYDDDVWPSVYDDDHDDYENDEDEDNDDDDAWPGVYDGCICFAGLSNPQSRLPTASHLSSSSSYSSSSSSSSS